MMKWNVNIGALLMLILAMIELVSCSSAEAPKSPSLQIVFANNRVIETPLKSVEQTSFWSEGDAFGVYATESSLSTFNFMSQNTKVSFTNLNGWSYDNPIYWPTEGQRFTFFAYFPYVGGNEPNKPILVDDSDGSFNLEYRVNEDVKLQEDLLWDWIINAYEFLPSGENTTVGNGKNTSFSFQHALSRVRFRVKAESAKTIYITSLSLTAYGNGLFSTIRTDGSINSPTTPTWETEGSLITFSVVNEFIPSADNKLGYVVDTKSNDLGFIVTRRNDYDAYYESFMIPQAKTEIRIRLTYNIVDDNTIGTQLAKKVSKDFLDIDFKNDWLLGHQYLYNINIDLEEATLSTSVGVWDDFTEII